MKHIWLLYDYDATWGAYSTEALAIEARKRAADRLQTSIYDERFNIVALRIDWTSDSEVRDES